MKHTMSLFASILLVTCLLLSFSGCKDPKAATKKIPIDSPAESIANINSETISTEEIGTEDNADHENWAASNENTFETVVEFDDDFEVAIGVGEPTGSPIETNENSDGSYGNWG